MVSERTSNCDLHISAQSSLFQQFPYIPSTKYENCYSFLTATYVSTPFIMKDSSFVEYGKQMMFIICISIFDEYGE